MENQRYKVAIVIYASLAEHGGHSRAYRALSTAQEFKNAKDDVVIVFDGAGTETLNTLAQAEHPDAALVNSLREHILGACFVCAKSYGVQTELEEKGFRLLRDHKGHASLRKLMAEGRTILTF